MARKSQQNPPRPKRAKKRTEPHQIASPGPSTEPESVGSLDEMLDGAEELLRGSITLQRQQLKLLNETQQNRGFHDGDLADTSSTLARSIAITTAELRKYQRQMEQRARALSDAEKFALTLKWVEILPRERRLELGQHIKRLEEADRGLLV